MPAGRRPFEDIGDMSITIPKPLLDVFKDYPRIVLRRFPPGLWPIDLRVIRDLQALEKVMKTKEFQEQFEVVIMPRGR